MMLLPQSSTAPPHRSTAPQHRSTASLRIDSLTFAFLALLALAFFDCLARFLSFLISGGVFSNLACFLIGLVCCAAALFCLIGRISLYAPPFNTPDIIFAVLFALYFFMKAIFPDSMADTLSYEIFVQEFSFTSKLEAMKPDLPSFAAWYSLGERVFHYFRVVFGYRLSILPNLLIYFAAFYKTKEILIGFFKEIFPDKLQKLRPSTVASIISGAAFLIFCDEFVVMGAVIIKPDLFVIPLLLECFRIVFQTVRRDAVIYALAGLLTGLSVAIKLTNVVYFLPLIVSIIFSDIRQKTFKPAKLCWGALGALIPIAPFALYGLIFTGNPVFPFFNAVFQSPYAVFENIKDIRWGPTGFLEALVWPFIVIFDTSRFGEIIGYSTFSNGRLAIGCIVCAVSIFVYKRAGLLQKRLPMALCILVCTLLWSASTGYVRYGMIIGMLAFIYLAVFVMDMLALRKRIWAVFFAPLAAASLSVSFLLITFYNFDWSWRPSVFKGMDYSASPAKLYYELDIPFYSEWASANLPYVMNDYTATERPILQMRFDAVKTWICLEGVTADAVIANPHADFFVLTNALNTVESSQGKAARYFSGRSAEGLYALERVDGAIEAKLNTYGQLGFTIESIEEADINCMDANLTALFIELSYNN